MYSHIIALSRNKFYRNSLLFCVCHGNYFRIINVVMNKVLINVNYHNYLDKKQYYLE